jgi:hypothetical protein
MIKKTSERRCKEDEGFDEKIRQDFCSSCICRGWRVRYSQGYYERRPETAEGGQGNPEQQDEKRITGTRDKEISSIENAVDH